MFMKNLPLASIPGIKQAFMNNNEWDGNYTYITGEGGLLQRLLSVVDTGYYGTYTTLKMMEIIDHSGGLCFCPSGNNKPLSMRVIIYHYGGVSFCLLGGRESHKMGK